MLTTWKMINKEDLNRNYLHMRQKNAQQQWLKRSGLTFKLAGIEIPSFNF